MILSVLSWDTFCAKIMADDYDAYIKAIFNSYDLIVGGIDLTVDLLWAHWLSSYSL